MLTLEEVEKMIQEGIPDAVVTVNDMTGTGETIWKPGSCRSPLQERASFNSTRWSTEHWATPCPIHALKLVTIATED